MVEDTKKCDLRAGVTPAGRVIRDGRGDTVWQWTEAESSSSTSVLLKALENEALRLEPTQAVPVTVAQAPRGASLETTSAVLRRFDSGAITLEPTRTTPALGRSAAATRRPAPRSREEAADEAPGRADAQGGFNPYDHS